MLVAPKAPKAGGAVDVKLKPPGPKAEVEEVGAVPAKPKDGAADDVAVCAPKPPKAEVPAVEVAPKPKPEAAVVAVPNAGAVEVAPKPKAGAGVEAAAPPNPKAGADVVAVVPPNPKPVVAAGAPKLVAAPKPTGFGVDEAPKLKLILTEINFLFQL